MPPRGFASPEILFLNTWDQPERAFALPIFKELRRRGYNRYVEPMAGAFVMPLVAREAFQPGEMEASDVSLFSSVCGYLLAGKDLAGLGVRVDGEPLELNGEPADQAAHILQTQLLLRMQTRPNVAYWRELVRDLTEREDQHRAAIRGGLERLQQRLGGLADYRAEDVWTHVARAAEDEHAVCSLNPPAYRAGFEKFYYTAGRLGWDEPEYEIFDASDGIRRICEIFEGKPGLLLIQEQKEPGNHSHPKPIYARHLSAGQYVYFLSNRPDEVFEITGGPKVKPKGGKTIEPLQGVPIIPPDYDIGPDAEIAIVELSEGQAAYYKQFWLHRLDGSDGGHNFGVIVDGRIAGIGGYSFASMTFTLPESNGVRRDKWADSVIMRYAIGAPHQYRLTRLATLVALQRQTLRALAGPGTQLYAEAAAGIITVEYTRHPESKGLRGLMKLADRKKDPRDGYRLFYHAPLGDLDYPQCLERWLAKEIDYHRKAATRV
jgi:hypothetical protein